MNVRLGRWVNAHLAPDAIVAVNDAGAIRYFGRRTTIDLLGLNHHEVLMTSYPISNPLRTLGVGYLIVPPDLFPGLLAKCRLVEMGRTRAAHYTICDAPQDLMVVYRIAGC
jgi:arabinofuranosyltransferase